MREGLDWRKRGGREREGGREGGRERERGREGWSRARVVRVSSRILGLGGARALHVGKILA